MPLPTVVVVVLALAICLAPLLLVGRSERPRAQDFFVAAQPTRPAVVRNALVGYGLRLTIVGALFAWGAAGDPWPAAVGASAFALGIRLAFPLRGRMAAFVDGALDSDRSITVHAFIARQSGGDSRVRRLAACLSALALSGLLACEIAALAAIASTIFPRAHPGTLWLVAIGALLLGALPVLAAGHSGVMHVAQLTLGMLYLGLFGSTLVLLYERVSALATMSPHATLATHALAAIAVVMLAFKRSRYVDTDPLRRTEAGRATSGARLMSRFAKLLNPALSVLLVLIVVVVLMKAFAAETPGTAVAPGEAPGGASAAALVALALAALFYPVVDVAHWQAFAVTRKGLAGVAPDRREGSVRKLFAGYAAELLLVSLFVAMFGVVSGTRDPSLSLPLVSLGVLAMVLSTTAPLFSALLCTIRYDLTSREATGAGEPAARRSAILAGALLVAAIAAALCLGGAAGIAGWPASTLAAPLVAFWCAQLALAPLVVGLLEARDASMSAGWALATLAAGAVTGIAAAAMALATGSHAWLWSAVPACLGSGFLVQVAARAMAR